MEMQDGAIESMDDQDVKNKNVEKPSIIVNSPLQRSRDFIVRNQP